MDLQQRKLNKIEWDSVEKDFSAEELNVLKLIRDGFHNPNVRSNNTQTLFTYLKMEYNAKMEDHLYNIYFRPACETIAENMKKIYHDFDCVQANKNVKISSADRIRLERNDVKKIMNMELYEYVLLNHARKIVSYHEKKSSTKFMSSYYTLSILFKNKIPNVNRHVVCVLEKILNKFKPSLDIAKLIANGETIIERNKDLLKYGDLTLYEHQKQIFNIFKINNKNNNNDNNNDNDKKTSENDNKTSEDKKTGKIDDDDDKSNCSEESEESIEYTSDSDDDDYEKDKPQAKLVLYMAPTGTGKTLTPIGLSEGYKILFVCVARHVGLALARSAIALKKKIAFAFGCESAADIRLHNYAVKDYVRRPDGSYIVYKGGNKKIDNSLGQNVEIMICDVQSYLIAMNYMRAFNKNEDGFNRHDNIILYWDEPTITLDYEQHEFHDMIKRNWNKNKIRNIVLSSATLPKLNEIDETINRFREKYRNNCIIDNIASYDCKKSIPIINNNGCVVLPHYLSDDYENIVEIANHCENNKTLLRYFDFKGIIDFIMYVNDNNYISTKYKIPYHFEEIDDLTMTKIKVYYIQILQNLMKGTWGAIYTYFKTVRRAKIMENTTYLNNNNNIHKSQSIGPESVNSPSGISSYNNMAGKPLGRAVSYGEVASAKTDIQNGTSGIYVTTKDAYTLTDGPTIFITENVEKVANFCIQQSKIPSVVMEDISRKIYYNNTLNEKIDVLEKEVECLKEDIEDVSGIESATSKTNGKDIRKFNRDCPDDVNTSSKIKLNKLTVEINQLRGKLKSVLLNESYIPNKELHKKKWAPRNTDTSISYTSDISEDIVDEIMLLCGVDNSYKVLLMMGIGVFINHTNIKYTEIMKKLADNQKLYMIIASSDYIYGTNYQFCHGYISKDLNLTQEKIIQAMGRIGRTNIQNDYTIRFRDDSLIMKLFSDEVEKPEIMNMNRLFS